jgi:hypothetical protein
MQMLSEPLDSEMDVRRHASGPPDGIPAGHSRCKINNVSRVVVVHLVALRCH